jgi:hypothetical protein
MIDMILRPLVEHPKRRWIVITLTFLFAIVFTWPSVDVYFAATEKYRTLESELAESEEVLGKLEMFKKQIEKKNGDLKSLEEKILSSKEIEQFRDQLVDWVKASGCKLRRIRLSDVQQRPWYEEDSPLDSRARAEKDKKSPFKLQQQQLNLQVAGPMEKILGFLGELGEQDRFLHTGNFQLRRSTDDANIIEMEMDLILFDLVVAGKTP